LLGPVLFKFRIREGPAILLGPVLFKFRIREGPAILLGPVLLKLEYGRERERDLEETEAHGSLGIQLLHRQLKMERLRLA
jgi:hypothetical protein